MTQLQNPIRKISTTTIRPPPRSPQPPPERIDLTAWDLSMFNAHYIQKGHLFSIPSISTDPNAIHPILTSLESSLSLTLLHFQPLAGRLVTTASADGLSVHVDCDDRGVEFTHAVADDVAVSDVAGPVDGDLPSGLLKHLFMYDGAVNYDGHTLALLAVQVTVLVDGIFLGCSFSHVVGDGTSFWHFFNAWAEVCRHGGPISRPPVHDRWFPDGTAVPVELPFKHPDEFVERTTTTALRERMFHFSDSTLVALKERANAECNVENTISRFQALSALVWRAITRLRGLPKHQSTSCRLAIENRSRLRPRLSPDYFGNSIYAMPTTTTAGELLAHDLGWAAMMLYRSVAAHDDEAIRNAVGKWFDKPLVYKMSMFDIYSVHMGSSPRFDMYGCEFGWGKAVAVRSGSANKFDGKVSAYQGREGGGSIDLEVCLLPEHMRKLELDEEFMAVVSGG